MSRSQLLNVGWYFAFSIIFGDQLDLHYTYNAQLGVGPFYPNTGTTATHQPNEVQISHNCISWYKVRRLLMDTSNSTFGCWVDCK